MMEGRIKGRKGKKKRNGRTQKVKMRARKGWDRKKRWRKGWEVEEMEGPEGEERDGKGRKKWKRKWDKESKYTRGGDRGGLGKKRHKNGKEGKGKGK